MKSAMLALTLCFLSPAFGESPFVYWGSGNTINVDDGTTLKGEGFSGVPPSYLVLVKAEDRHSRLKWVGSGAFLSDRLVLTCYHNVRGLSESDGVAIHTTSGVVYRNTRVVHTHKDHDLALIYIDDPVVLYHRAIRVKNTAGNLTDLALMGFDPGKDAMALYQGVKTGRTYSNRNANGPVTFETTAKIYRGMSGGPMVDASLKLVGVGIQKTGDNSLVVMLEHIQAFLTDYDGPIGNLNVENWNWKSLLRPLLLKD